MVDIQIMAPVRRFIGRRQARLTNHPMTSAIKNGAATVVTPPMEVPSLWLRRPTITNASTAVISSATATATERELVRVVILATKVCDLVLAHYPAQSVLQLGELNKQVVLGVKARCNLRALVIERKPFLNTTQTGALG